MRTVVGVILLVLAVGLASLGLFWSAPEVDPKLSPTGPLGGVVRTDNSGRRLSFPTFSPRAQDTQTRAGIEKTPEANSANTAAAPETKRAAEAAAEHYENAPSKGAEKAAETPKPSISGDIQRGPGPNNDLQKIVENRKRIEQLPKGNIVLDGPIAMKVTETRAVHANVGLNMPIEKLRKGVRLGDQAVGGILPVSSDMIAVLSGPGFKVTATTPEQQSVAEGFPTVWSWDVEAKNAGDQELEATLYALTPSRQRIDSYKHKISVSVMEQTWSEWVKSFRDEIDAIKGIVVTLSGVVTGVVGWLVLYSDRRRKKEAQSLPS